MNKRHLKTLLGMSKHVVWVIEGSFREKLCLANCFEITECMNLCSISRIKLLNDHNLSLIGDIQLPSWLQLAYQARYFEASCSKWIDKSKNK